MNTGWLIDRLKEFLNEQIERLSAEIAEHKEVLGANYDPNAYGVGYDEGGLSAYENVRAILEGREPVI